MLGRGMVSDPGLALAIVAASRPQVVGSHADQMAAGTAPASIDWADLQPLVAAFWALVQARGDLAERHRPGRLKQWLNQLRRCHPQAEALYGELRAISEPRRITEHLAESTRSASVFNAFAGSRQSPIPGCRQAA
jgi:tRNA-dihydrouridine synthase C